MNRLSLLIFSFLLTQSLGQDLNGSPRKGNFISKFLDQALESLFAELSKNNLSIPVIDLGDNVGRFDNVECHFPELRKKVDGYKGNEFSIDADAMKTQLTGHYDILKLDIPGLFPVYGEGNFRITAERITLKLLTHVLYNTTEEKFNFTVLKFEILVQKPKVKFHNFMNDPPITDFLNELITDLVPDLVTLITQPAKKLLQFLINIYGNGVYNCIRKEPTLEKIEECIKNLFSTDIAGLFPLEKLLRRIIGAKGLTS